MTTVAGVLNEAQVMQAQQRAAAIVDAAQPRAIKKEQFVFFAAFDGTRNDMKDIPLSGNPQDTNVAELYKQVDKQAQNNPESNVVARYYPGHGTQGSLPRSAWQPAQVTQEAINTAQLAYEQFADQASKWLNKHPNGEVTTAITSFSRGGAQAAIFSQLLYRDGLIDPDTKKVLIPPGKVGVSAGMIFDPVTTGVDGNMAFAPNVNNVMILLAESEYRGAFYAVNHENRPGLTVQNVTGNHCNIGGGYGDDGLGNLYLAAATKFFQKSGLDIAEVDPSRRVNANQIYKVYDESDQVRDDPLAFLGQRKSGKWSTTDFYQQDTLEQPVRHLDKVVIPPKAVETEQGEKLEFKLYNGKTILRENYDKARAYLEKQPSTAIEQYPELLGAVSWRMKMLAETAYMAPQTQQNTMRHFDMQMINKISAGEFPAPPEINAYPVLAKTQEAVLETS
ncbi:MAG: hypothetical protein CVU29_05965 [Betaproteobacteria bacterium HGW-Betaproteobacteria-22]|nr:MAG: hypothetical protein CVU29_05965 [Betaproteobacteria bacterium HGW-Betaproteobacteria-22]